MTEPVFKNRLDGREIAPPHDFMGAMDCDTNIGLGEGAALLVRDVKMFRAAVWLTVQAAFFSRGPSYRDR